MAQYYPRFQALMAQQATPLPVYVQQEFEAYLKCGRLEHGFLRVHCVSCHHEKLVAFSCKKRGFCPSCGARRMVDSAALLSDEVLPKVPLRQWVLSVPFLLRFLFASYPELMGRALGIVYRTIATWLIHQGGFTHNTARTGVERHTGRQPHSTQPGPARARVLAQRTIRVRKLLNNFMDDATGRIAGYASCKS